MSDIGNRILDGASDFGKIMAKIQLAIAFIIVCCFIVSCVYILTTDDTDNYIAIDGTVISTDCKTPQSQSTRCTLKVEYVIDNVTYSNMIVTNDMTGHVKNESIKLIIMMLN